jgi:hypothetical protein
MAVRLTLSQQDDDIHGNGTAAARQSVGRTLRNRFGFSLIQAPLRKLSPFWVTDLDAPEQRYEPVRQPTPAHPTRPIEGDLELSLLLRGRPLTPRA